MLLLLYRLLCAIFEHPLYGLCLWTGTLDWLGMLERGPEVVEVWELDKVPDLG